MERIKFYGYKYAPESIRVYVNGQKLNTAETMINNYIVEGKRNEAAEAIKKIYRKENSKENNYIYAFFAENSKQFYYISALSFKASDSIMRRLYCFKELKKHLQTYPPTYQTEAGHVTPSGSTAPEVKTEEIKIDFKKLIKLKIV